MSRRHITLIFGACALLALASPALANAQHLADITITDWIRASWPIVVAVAGLITTGVLLGLGTRFAPAAAFGALRLRVDQIDVECAVRDRRIADLEKSIDSSPTRQELQEDISELSERMKGVEVGLEGIGGQLKTTNTYLHTIIERGMRGAA